MSLNNVLVNIPDGLRNPLITEFNKIIKNFREMRWEPTGLNGGKLAEIVYTILEGYISGSYSPKPSKPRNMVDACRKLEQASNNHPKSIKIQIPRVLVALYEIRNNRGIGHTGGDVDPNHMDAMVVIYMSKWVMSELIRVFHNVSTDEAQGIVESIIVKENPLIWGINDGKRVLDTSLSKVDQTLLLLHSCNGEVDENELFSWVEYSNKAVFRRDILVKNHNKRFLEYNKTKGTVVLSPSGIEHVESKIINKG